MKKNRYDLDILISKTMKNRMGSVHASDELIKKTLQRMKEEEYTKGPVVTPVILKAKRRLPIPLISGIAAAVVALVAVLAVYSIRRPDKISGVIEPTTSPNISAVETQRPPETKKAVSVFDSGNYVPVQQVIRNITSDPLSALAYSELVLTDGNCFYSLNNYYFGLLDRKYLYNDSQTVTEMPSSQQTERSDDSRHADVLKMARSTRI